MPKTMFIGTASFWIAAGIHTFAPPGNVKVISATAILFVISFASFMILFTDWQG